MRPAATKINTSRTRYSRYASVHLTVYPVILHVHVARLEIVFDVTVWLVRRSVFNRSQAKRIVYSCRADILKSVSQPLLHTKCSLELSISPSQATICFPSVNVSDHQTLSFHRKTETLFTLFVTYNQIRLTISIQFNFISYQS